MSRVKVLAGAMVIVVCLAAPTTAELCTIDAVPAATVLIPYFEVDLNKLGPFGSSNGSKLDNTKVTLINNSDQSIIVHVILWTNLSLPTLNFDIPLTGWDEHDMDIDAIFNGVLPIPSGSHPSGCTQCGGPSPTGPEHGFGCANVSPADSVTVQDVRNAHAGRSSSFYGGCMGRSTGGNLATGYITMDVASACSRIFPNESGYFESGGNGIATNDNVLTATITRFSKKFLTEVPAVMVEAGTSDGLDTGYTFYGRYNQEQALDNRECGSNTWIFPFDTKAGLKTFAQVWRDSRVDFGTASGFSCGSTPSWYELAPSDRIIAYDDQENARELDVDPFPAETQSVQVGKGTFKTPYSTGWIKLILGEQEELQSYVIVNQRNRKRQSEAYAHYATQTICGTQDDNGAAAQRRSRRR